MEPCAVLSNPLHFWILLAISMLLLRKSTLIIWFQDICQSPDRICSFSFLFFRISFFFFFFSSYHFSLPPSEWMSWADDSSSNLITRNLHYLTRNSCLNTVRFWVNLSLFFESKLRVTSAISFSKQRERRGCWSTACILTQQMSVKKIFFNLIFSFFSSHPHTGERELKLPCAFFRKKEKSPNMYQQNQIYEIRRMIIIPLFF